MENSELKKFVNYLRDNFGDTLMEHQGDIHDYLDIDLDYSEKGKFKLSMVKYLQKIITEFSELIGADATSPSQDHLFQIFN